MDWPRPTSLLVLGEEEDVQRRGWAQELWVVTCSSGPANGIWGRVGWEETCPRGWLRKDEGPLFSFPTRYRRGLLQERSGRDQQGRHGLQTTVDDKGEEAGERSQNSWMDIEAEKKVEHRTRPVEFWNQKETHSTRSWK